MKIIIDLHSYAAQSGLVQTLQVNIDIPPYPLIPRTALTAASAPMEFPCLFSASCFRPGRTARDPRDAEKDMPRLCWGRTVAHSFSSGQAEHVPQGAGGKSFLCFFLFSFLSTSFLTFSFFFSPLSPFLSFPSLPCPSLYLSSSSLPAPFCFFVFIIILLFLFQFLLLLHFCCSLSSFFSFNFFFSSFSFSSLFFPPPPFLFHLFFLHLLFFASSCCFQWRSLGKKDDTDSLRSMMIFIKTFTISALQENAMRDQNLMTFVWWCVCTCVCFKTDSKEKRKVIDVWMQKGPGGIWMTVGLFAHVCVCNRNEEGKD